MTIISRAWLIQEYTGSPYKDRKVVYGTLSVTGTGNEDTGLREIETAFANLRAAETVFENVKITSVAGGTLSFHVITGGTATSTTARTVEYIAIGKA